MPDYKRLYYNTFHAITEAEHQLTKARIVLRRVQRECEIALEELDDAVIAPNTKEES